MSTDNTLAGSAMTETEVLAKVREAFKTSFDIDPQTITMDTTADDVPGWDSVGHLSLGATLEEAFGVSLDVDDLMEMENVRGIVRILTAKLAKKAK